MPSPGRSDTSTCPRSMRMGRAVTSSASPSLDSVSPQAICGSAAAIWSGGRAGDAGFAGLARHVDADAELLAQAARRHHAAHAAELDGLEAHAARGLALVVAADVVERMDALVGADRDPARAAATAAMPAMSSACTGCSKKSSPASATARTYCTRLVRAPALVGVGRDQRAAAEQLRRCGACARRRPAACRCRP